MSIDWPAVHAALNDLSLAAFCLDRGDRPGAEEAFREAAVAAVGAFPQGSSGTASIEVLLDVFSREIRAVAA